VLTIGLLSLMAVSLLATSTKSSSLSFEGIKAVELHLDGGQVTLSGGGGSLVSGTRKVRSDWRHPSFSERVGSDGTLVLRSKCTSFFSPSCSVGYTLTVPSGVRITGSSSGGSITVRRTNAEVHVSSSGGGIRAEDVRGDLDLVSSGGGITVTRASSQRVKADSSGGGVRIEFAAEPMRVDASSSGGGVRVIVPKTPVAYRVSA
jgi:hypothetical protein